MGHLFPFTGVNRVNRTEADIFELEFDGELPADLNGTFYRCGPDPQVIPKFADDFFINGDGMVSMFRFKGGHVDFKMRYVRTDKFELERRARRALFGAYRNPYTDDPLVQSEDRTTANTNVLWHAGRLFALKEDGLPHELDPDTLETRGKWNFGGSLRSPTFTAHPKEDPHTGELIFNGYEAGGLATPDIAVGFVDRRGKLTKEIWFVPPYASMIHDFAVTEHYVLFPIMPTTSDIDRIKAGGSHWAWDESKETLIGVLRRDGDGSDVRYFRGPSRWSYHVMNAFEDGDLVHLDLQAAEINFFPYFPNIQGKPWDPARATPYLRRWTCNLAANGDTFSERLLWDKPVDFTRIDPRYMTRKYRHGFMCAKDFSKPVSPELGAPPLFNLLAHIDHQSGAVESWWVGKDSGAQEPVFVPRSPQAAEGDGYLLAIVNRHMEARSELVVMDALNLAKGPIATAHIPMQLRLAFHGEFVAEHSRQAGQAH
jgi:carotenoid cleavage dioxygenase